MKLTGEDIAALILAGVATFLICGGIVYVAFRFHSLDWKSLFKKDKWHY
jgi:hypothetical protein